MLFVIDNGEVNREAREIFFVMAPASFEHWFNTVLVPWQIFAIEHPEKHKAWFERHSLICIATSARFPSSRPITVGSYLAKNSLTPQLTYHLWDNELTPYKHGES